MGHLVQGHVAAPGLIGDDVSLAQDAVEHRINSHVVLCKHHGVYSGWKRAVVFSNTSSSDSQGPGQAAVVARSSGVCALSCRGQLQMPM